MDPRPLGLMALLAAQMLSGCAMLDELLGGGPCSAYTFDRTVPDDGVETSRGFTLVVVQDEPVPAAIVATGTAGREEATGSSDRNTPITLQVPDGVWEIQYIIDGEVCDDFSGVSIDATAPEILGIPSAVDAPQGHYTIGESAVIEGGVRVQVEEHDTGVLLSDRLPYTVTALPSGIHAYLIKAYDEVGNVARHTIQVRVGQASALPEGDATFGIVARYSNDARLWDLSDPGRYASPSEARLRVNDAFLGTGYGIDPDDPAVQSIVSDTAAGSTVEVAWELFAWVFDNLEYDEVRRDDQSVDDLYGPGETLAAGGGVCRDLAAFYVSLLRAAGIPARLVTGYVAGNVDGFHAWVQFYAGGVDGQDPWMTVDVSGIDGPFDDVAALQAFGIQRSDYLPLREVPSSGEVEGWSTALSVDYRYFGREPDTSFEKEPRVEGVQTLGVLCMEPSTRARSLAPADSAEEAHEACAQAGLGSVIGLGGGAPSYPLFTQTLIDYGVLVENAPPDTEVTVEVAYPFADASRPNDVDFLVYGDDAVGEWRLDHSTGRYIASFVL